jgi:multicomponent Na+:H+ antiporter subunit D
MIAAHLPALQVVLPLISAPLMVLVRRGGIAYGLMLTVAWISLLISLLLAQQVAEFGPISYHIGNWPPPWGIEYRVDALSSFVLVLVSLAGAVVVPYSRRSVMSEVPQALHYLFYSMFALCLTGLLGITITGDAFNIFVFLEISSLSTYVLIALGRDRRALTAAYQYLIMGTIGATFIVIGVGLLYLMTGSLNLVDIAQRLPAVAEKRPVLAALAFLTVGISLKLALFPLHLWLPNAYTYAPSSISAFLAATATKVSVYVLIRFYYSVFGDSLVFRDLQILLVLSIAAMITASLAAIYQNNLKRLFAYSSVAQIGYITLGLSLDSVGGLSAAIVHLFNHALAKGALFMLIGGIMLRTGDVTLSHAAGLARRMPVTALGIVIAGLTLIGVPGTAGFVSKWALITASLEAGRWWLVPLIVASSLLAVAYVWRFVEAAYLREPPPESQEKNEAPWSMLVPAWLLVALSIYFGIDTRFTLGGATRAAQMLLGVGG